MTGPGFTLTVGCHSLKADMPPERRIRLARLWRHIAVGMLARARGMRHDGDTRGAEQWEQAAADWCEAADQLEWQARDTQTQGVQG